MAKGFENGKIYTIRNYKPEGMKSVIQPKDMGKVAEMAEKLKGVVEFGGDSKDCPAIVNRILNTYLSSTLFLGDGVFNEEQDGLLEVPKEDEAPEEKVVRDPEDVVKQLPAQRHTKK